MALFVLLFGEGMRVLVLVYLFGNWKLLIFGLRLLSRKVVKLDIEASFSVLSFVVIIVDFTFVLWLFFLIPKPVVLLRIVKVF